MFITFEGLDGSGKTTHIERLHYFLKYELKKNVMATREPGGTELAEELREILLNREMSDRTRIMLFNAARSDHVDKLIRPSLESGQIVLCDRYTDSTLAYQGVDDLHIKMANDVNAYGSYGLYPDLRIFLDISPQTCIDRRGMNKTNFLGQKT